METLKSIHEYFLLKQFNWYELTFIYILAELVSISVNITTS